MQAKGKTMIAKENGTNVTFTLDEVIVAWLDEKVQASDLNRSQVARKIFREAMAAEKRKGKKNG